MVKQDAFNKLWTLPINFEGQTPQINLYNCKVGNIVSDSAVSGSVVGGSVNTCSGDFAGGNSIQPIYPGYDNSLDDESELAQRRRAGFYPSRQVRFD